MKRLLLALVMIFAPALLSAQTVSGTATWTPNPSTDNVVQYTIQLNALPPVIVLPVACTPAPCKQALPAIPFGTNTLTLTAQNVAVSGGALQSSLPATLTFTVNTRPVTVLGVGVTVP
jgi:hypothetical protein